MKPHDHMSVICYMTDVNEYLQLINGVEKILELGFTKDEKIYEGFFTFQKANDAIR